jgi:hypothetical protein
LLSGIGGYLCQLLQHPSDQQLGTPPSTFILHQSCVWIFLLNMMARACF